MVDVNDSLGKIEYRIQIVAIQGIWHLEPYLYTYQEDGCNKSQAIYMWVFLGIDINSKHEKAGAYNADSCLCLSFYTILFLMELLPIRTPLCFRLRDKVTK